MDLGTEVMRDLVDFGADVVAGKLRNGKHKVAAQTRPEFSEPKRCQFTLSAGLLNSWHMQDNSRGLVIVCGSVAQGDMRSPAGTLSQPRAKLLR